MTDKIASLLTEDAIWLPVKKRTAAVMAEMYALQEKIEAANKGSIEIIIDFKDGTVKPPVLLAPGHEMKGRVAQAQPGTLNSRRHPPLTNYEM